MRRVASFTIFAWAIVSALATGAIIVWLRERYARTVFSASGAESLLMPIREYLLPVQATLECLHLKEGNTVLELGPGPGYFSIEASHMVGLTGRLLCLDLQPGMAEILRERLRSEGASAGRPVVGDATRLPLASHSVDKAFVAVMFGEIPDRPAALKELRRVLKPDGILGFCETFADPDYMFLTELIDLCRAYGFEKLEKHSQLLGYTLTFATPDE